MANLKQPDNEIKENSINTSKETSDADKEIHAAKAKKICRIAISFFTVIGLVTAALFTIKHVPADIDNYIVKTTPRQNKATKKKDIDAGSDATTKNLGYWFETDNSLVISNNELLEKNYSETDRPVWDSEKNRITHIKIKNSVKTIGAYAFYNFTSLKQVTIGDETTEISDYAFYGCRELSKITFPKNSQLCKIGNYAFANCALLNSVSDFLSVETVGNNAFEGCVSLGELSFADNTEFGDNVFNLCNMESLTLKCCKDTAVYEYAVTNNIKISDTSVQSDGIGSTLNCDEAVQSDTTILSDSTNSPKV